MRGSGPGHRLSTKRLWQAPLAAQPRLTRILGERIPATVIAALALVAVGIWLASRKPAGRGRA